MKVDHSMTPALEATARRDRYAAPTVQTYTAQEILGVLGPAQALTSGASPGDYLGGNHGHGRGHGHGHGRH